MLTTTIDLLRHGEVEGGQYYRGQKDDALTEKGWQQMQAALQPPFPWQQLVSSSLLRCRDFAQQLSEQHALPLQCDDNFCEIHFGQWQGKTVDELMVTHKAELLKYWQDPQCYTPPGAESLPEFKARVLQAWQQLLAEHRGKHVLLISHGGVMGVILSEILAIPDTHLLRMDIRHAALTRIVVEHDQQQDYPRVVFQQGQA